MTNERIHRLVIVGGGVAGLDIASRLAGTRAGDARLHVTLIDREPAYVWKPMLHTVAAGTSDAGTQQTVYAAQAASHGFAYHPGAATAIDRAAHTVTIAPLMLAGQEVIPERTIPYDTLVLAVGSRADDFGTRGVADHCATIDTRSDAVAFNERLRIELLRRAAEDAPLTIGIVGGGATGVELAAELVRVADVAEDYGLTGAQSRLNVVLIEAGPAILTAFPDRIATSATAKLERLGITVRTGTAVDTVTQTGFRLADGTDVACDLRVWAAGVRATPLLDTLGDVERVRSGRVTVDDRLRLPADPNVYALGDCASVPDGDGTAPTTAQAASQQARWLCDNLPRMIAGQAVRPVTYRDFGSLLSLGGYDAYGTLGRFGLLDGFLRGRVAQLGHTLLYRRYQVRLHGVVKGSLLWLLDTIATRVRPRIRLN